VTLGIFFIVLGNVTFNLLLALYENSIDRRNFLIINSLFMMISGIILLLSRSFILILIALFMENGNWPISISGGWNNP